MQSKRRRLISLVTVIVLAVLSLAYTFRSGNSPLLGLDLQGGLSVVLKPKVETDDDKIQQAIAIMRQRIDAIGVAEPEISQQGGNILIQIPGVQDRDRALQLVGQTAELRFRPVLCSAPYTPPDASASTTAPPTTAAGAPAGDASTTVAPPTTAAPASPTSQVGLGPLSGYSVGESAAGEQAQAPASDAPTPAPAASTPSPSDVAPTTPTAPNPAASIPGAAAATPSASAAAGAAGSGCAPGTPITQPSDDKADQTVVLPGLDDPKDPNRIMTIYQLGPAQATGNILSDANASLSQQGQWTVNPRFKPGADGIDIFNKSAAQCNPQSAICPTGRQAITLDGRVISAPQIEPGQTFTPFDADRVQISGNFTEDSAKELATQLKYGALPVELEQQQAESVSATLGRDALNAGLISGFVGLALVAIYMITFYRLLGVMAVFKLAIEGALLWSFISYLGSNAGLALTLAGVTGIIVSIGVSLDSNVVYYEHLKEDVRNGRTVRSSVDKAFSSSFRTILKADGVSIIGASLLYILSVGPVRGFAFYLIVSMVLDLFTSYFYMHPAVAIALQSKFCSRRPSWFGVPKVDFDATPLAQAAKKAGARKAIPTRPSRRTKYDEKVSKDDEAEKVDEPAESDEKSDETTTVT
jgi:preprotein translocase subunit SecD